MRFSCRVTLNQGHLRKISMMKSIVLLLCVFWGCLPFGHSYNNGAPEKACRDMFPIGHHVDSKSTQPPYRVVVLQNTYHPGKDNVTVIIQATTSAGFKGFFLQARKADCKISEFEMAVGRFYVNDADVKVISCPDGQGNNAVTHASSNMKYGKSFTWVNWNPEGGDVFFQATIVQEKTIFWAGVRSGVVRDSTKALVGEHPHCPAKTKMDDWPVTASASQTWASLNTLMICSVLVLNKYL